MLFSNDHKTLYRKKYILINYNYHYYYKTILVLLQKSSSYYQNININVNTPRDARRSKKQYHKNMI